MPPAIEEGFSSYLITDFQELDEAMRREPLSSWEMLLDRDPSATLFQGPLWTSHWYRAYLKTFAPLVLLVACRGRLVGVVPMAVEKRSHRITFAGDQMADYRDIVAEPECREEVIRRLVAAYRSGRYRNVLRLGPTMPDSPSPDILERVCREENVGAIRRSHYGWRWWASEAKQLEDPTRKKSVRYPLSYLRKRGEVSADRIVSREEWTTLRDEFYNQHSLRQLQAGRQLSFDNPQKRAFFDSLFDSPLAHVTVLRVAGRPVACHYGCISKNVLYWGAPSFDVRQHRYSPGLLLVVLTMKRAAEWGIQGFDLTIGEGNLKERFSTSRVVLPTIEIYPRGGAYLARRIADVSVALARRRLAARWGEDFWPKVARPALLQIGAHLQTAVSAGPAHTFPYLRETLLAPVCGKTRTVVFQMPPADARPAGGTASNHVFGHDQIYDLLKTRSASRYITRRLSVTAGKLAEAAHQGADFHTLVVDGSLAAWGFSRMLTEESASGIDGLTIPSGSAVLYDFDRAPGVGSVLADLVTHVAAERVQQGAAQLFLIAVNPARAVEHATQKAGFRKACVRTSTRILRWQKSRTDTSASL